MVRTRLVAGNWKMHGSLNKNQALLEKVLIGTQALQNVSCVVCVPYPYLSQMHSILSGSHVAWGGQNVSQHDQGAYTGEVSASMLTDFECSYVVVGHSERRSLYGETNQIVAEKFKTAQRALLIPILCVGETLEQRESGKAEQIIGEQLDAVVELAGVTALSKSVIAYEPVWAIGTGKTATPEQAQEIHAFIRSKIAALNANIASDIKILYGGSVKAGNAQNLFSMPDIDGGLIGGASLVAEEFVSICAAAQQKS